MTEDWLTRAVQAAHAWSQAEAAEFEAVGPRSAPQGRTPSDGLGPRAEGTARGPIGALARHTSQAPADLAADWEERAAILEFEGGMSRTNAEALATELSGGKDD